MDNLAINLFGLVTEGYSDAGQQPAMEVREEGSAAEAVGGGVEAG